VWDAQGKASFQVTKRLEVIDNNTFDRHAPSPVDYPVSTELYAALKNDANWTGFGKNLFWTGLAGTEGKPSKTAK
jgi:hypothetical protein